MLMAPTCKPALRAADTARRTAASVKGRSLVITARCRRGPVTSIQNARGTPHFLLPRIGITGSERSALQRLRRNPCGQLRGRMARLGARARGAQMAKPERARSPMSLRPSLVSLARSECLRDRKNSEISDFGFIGAIAGIQFPRRPSFSISLRGKGKRYGWWGHRDGVPWPWASDLLSQG
jgi:hypothetical protein